MIILYYYIRIVKHINKKGQFKNVKHHCIHLPQ